MKQLLIFLKMFGLITLAWLMFLAALDAIYYAPQVAFDVLHGGVTSH